MLFPCLEDDCGGGRRCTILVPAELRVAGIHFPSWTQSEIHYSVATLPKFERTSSSDHCSLLRCVVDHPSNVGCEAHEKYEPGSFWFFGCEPSHWV